MNKIINGHQCTIRWHVNDLKILHRDEAVVEDVVMALEQKYGQEAPLTVHRGPVHQYLGMTIDYRTVGRVTFSMQQYVHDILDKATDLISGHPQSPAANHLFKINPEAPKISPKDKEQFHHLTAKLLNMAKQTRPDLLLAVAFLLTRVQSPDVDNWKKLARCLSYLCKTAKLTLTLDTSELTTIQWWVDASFGVHSGVKSHTGALMSLGKGCPINMSSKQKINTRSSTEAKLVSINDAISTMLWVRNFLEAQGFEIHNNLKYQDNQSTMLLAKNGRRSSGKKTRHIDICYYFITDQTVQGKVNVKYCWTSDMVADFFTKPLQGAAFWKLQALLLNLSPDPLGQECVGANEVRATGGAGSPTNAATTLATTEEAHPAWAMTRSYANAVFGTSVHAIPTGATPTASPIGAQNSILRSYDCSTLTSLSSRKARVKFLE